MHIDSANLNNLTQLWQRYGACSLYEDEQLQLHKNISWPNRVWADMASPFSEKSLEQISKKIPEALLFPLWPAMTEDGSAALQATVDALVHQNSHWQPVVQHTAMVLEIDKRVSVNTQRVARYPLNIKCLSNDSDIATWVTTGSKAFGYTIDENVITSLLTYEDIQIFIAYNDDSHPIATGLLFKTGDVVGIHQIGVPVEYQGRGYATQMMGFLIQYAKKWKANHVVLQASKEGRPVYQKLGFVEQFLITYLQKSTGKTTMGIK